MNVLLIDDHPLFGLGFVQALTLGRPDVDARTAPTLDQGLALAERWAALDVVLINHRPGAEDGVRGLRRFGAHHPRVARGLIAAEEHQVLPAQARAAGAAALLGKSMSADELREALEEVLRGGHVFPSWSMSATALDSPGPTSRQREVLGLVASGRQNKQIAYELGIAERTVKLHVTALLSATAARNRTHLLVRARELGLL